MKDIFLIRTYGKEGEEKSEWVKAGVAFNPNKDGSINLSMYMFPDVKFQIRERKQKETTQTNPQVDWS